MKTLIYGGHVIDPANRVNSKLNLLVGVPEDRYEEAIRAIYAAIDESMREPE